MKSICISEELSLYGAQLQRNFLCQFRSYYSVAADCTYKIIKLFNVGDMMAISEHVSVAMLLGALLLSELNDEEPNGSCCGGEARYGNESVGIFPTLPPRLVTGIRLLEDSLVL